MQVNRYLKDKSFDRIDHALGRPVDPTGDTYRNHFAASTCEADQFATPNWAETYRHSDLVGFRVTDEGRAALRDHLREIGDRHRLYLVTWQGYEMTQPATSASKARYAKYLSVSDADCDLTFKDFAATARVRLA